MSRHRISYDESTNPSNGWRAPEPEPDDLCEACRKEVATIECGHGILCQTCSHQVHGNQECDL